MNNVQYIPEQKAFLVNGRLIKEETLTIQEKQELIQKSQGNLSLLIGKQDNQNVQVI